MTKTAIKFLDSMATDTHGATCAMCTKVYKIWYIGAIQIGRVYCKCETVPADATKYGARPTAAQQAE